MNEALKFDVDAAEKDSKAEEDEAETRTGKEGEEDKNKKWVEEGLLKGC